MNPDGTDDRTLPSLHFRRVRDRSAWQLSAVTRDDGTPLGDVERIDVRRDRWRATRHHDLAQEEFPTRREAAGWLDETGPAR